ncbi:MAG TPA: hypothetical protein VGB37_13935 [Candidatus Lokiarchaeia archaeon]
MNDNMTLNEIESDVKKITELNKVLIQGAVNNFKVASEIAKKVTEENYKISNSIQKINDSLEKIGKIADSVGMAYESKTHDLSETLNY